MEPIDLSAFDGHTPACEDGRWKFCTERPYPNAYAEESFIYGHGGIPVCDFGRPLSADDLTPIGRPPQGPDRALFLGAPALLTEVKSLRGGVSLAIEWIKGIKKRAEDEKAYLESIFPPQEKELTENGDYLKLVNKDLESLQALLPEVKDV